MGETQAHVCSVKNLLHWVCGGLYWYSCARESNLRSSEFALLRNITGQKMSIVSEVYGKNFFKSIRCFGVLLESSLEIKSRILKVTHVILLRRVILWHS